MGVPTATEFLDMVTGQFLVNLISSVSIGARIPKVRSTAKWLRHSAVRVGFKNGTDGNTRIAVDAIRATRASHMFLCRQKWSDDHLSDQRQPVWPHYYAWWQKTNYHADDIAAACDTLHEFDLPEHLVVDFSHGNCQKQHRRQFKVGEEICSKSAMALRRLLELWRESFLREGNTKKWWSAAHLQWNPLPTRVWLGKS
ncbi:hypothetical protein ACLK2I_09450 [Escherichia coli]